MPVPRHTPVPPFNIVRASHIALGVTDLPRARAFYEGALGFDSEEATDHTVYLRGMEERQHHSLVLVKSAVPLAYALGFRVASEEDIDRAAHWARVSGLQHGLVERAYQGRTLQIVDPWGLPIELIASMDRRESLLQRYHLYKGVHPQRLDHFNVLSPDVQGQMELFAGLGFRLTEYAEEDGPGGRIAAAWLQRKGNVHDIALTNGRGPRLHHVAYWCPGPMNVLHLCDSLASGGWLHSMERGPGRHGISNAFFLYVRCPDGHRIEIYTSDYQTMDPDHEPLRWSLRDPRRQTLWGQPAPRSWFEEGSALIGVREREATFQAQVLVAD